MNVSLCLSVCAHISTVTHGRTPPDFLRMLTVVVAQSSSGGIASYFRFCVYDVNFSHSRHHIFLRGGNDFKQILLDDMDQYKYAYVGYAPGEVCSRRFSCYRSAADYAYSENVSLRYFPDVRTTQGARVHVPYGVLHVDSYRSVD